MIQSDYVCPRFVTVDSGSRWHNWSLNVATVRGWTFLPNREVPILWDTRCINNQTPGRSNQLYAGLPSKGGWNFVGIPGQYPRQRTNAIVRRRISIGLLFLRSPWRIFTSSLRAVLYRASQQTLRCASKYILRLRKSWPVDRGFVIEPKNIVINISSV